ncbi:MAG: ribonuclease III, partial [Candidatus Binatia bacterium]
MVRLSDVNRESLLAELQVELQYSFADAALLARCMTHVSYERSQKDGHNEVLEFLGDAVLDLAIS